MQNTTEKSSRSAEGPVSYTHLDVYKRQVLLLKGYGVSGRFQLLCKRSILLVGGNVTAQLDVYKRQPQGCKCYSGLLHFRRSAFSSPQTAGCAFVRAFCAANPHRPWAM